MAEAEPTSRPIPEPLLERYLAGAMSPEAKAQLEARLAASAEDQTRLQALRDAHRAILVSDPPAAFAHQISERLRLGRKRSWWIAGFGLAPLAAAAALLLTLRQPLGPNIEIKGGLALTVHRRVPGGSEVIGEQDLLSAGDQLRFEVHASAPGFVALLDRDASGAVSVFFPTGGERAAPFDPKSPLLPPAIELDTASGAERLYLFYDSRPFDLKGLVEALSRDAGRSRIPFAGQVEIRGLRKR